MASRPILIAALLVATPFLFAGPAVAGDPCATAPCVDATWHDCGNGNTPPQFRCNSVCYTVRWDPPYPDNFWVSATWCQPLLGDVK